MFDVVLCFLCNPMGSGFWEPVYNDTLFAWDLELGVFGRSLKGAFVGFGGLGVRCGENGSFSRTRVLFSTVRAGTEPFLARG